MVGAHQDLNGSRDLTTPFLGMVRTCYHQPTYSYQVWSLYRHVRIWESQTPHTLKCWWRSFESNYERLAVCFGAVNLCFIRAITSRLPCRWRIAHGSCWLTATLRRVIISKLIDSMNNESEPVPLMLLMLGPRGDELETERSRCVIGNQYPHPTHTHTHTPSDSRALFDTDTLDWCAVKRWQGTGLIYILQQNMKIGETNNTKKPDGTRGDVQNWRSNDHDVHDL